jgi:hypothetical protein
MQPIELRLTHVEQVFRLEIANTSQTPVRVWSTNFSLGYYSIYLLVSPPNETPCLIKRKPKRWTVNVPDSVVIQPGDAHFEKLDLHDGTWDNSGCSIDPRSEVDVGAVVEISPDKDTARYGVITGRYESNRQRIKWSEIIN